MTTPTAFITYSWDDEDHKAWVKGLAERLRAGGVNVLLDIWGVAPGGQLPELMNLRAVLVITRRQRSGYVFGPY